MVTVALCHGSINPDRVAPITLPLNLIGICNHRTLILDHAYRFQVALDRHSKCGAARCGPWTTLNMKI